MTFPDTPRVIYEKNPLVEVICQLKFPPVLRVETELPAAFQELIRADYPFLETADAAEAPIPPAILRLIQQSAPGLVQGRIYHFLSTDSEWKLTVSRDFIALSTTTYKRWEEFRKKLKDAVDAFVQIYSPAFFVRIGLRYRDVIPKSAEFLKGLDWPDILQPHILGELGPLELRNAIQHAARDVLVTLKNPLGQVRILHGLIRVPGDNDFSYSIDSDFFSEEKTDIEHAFEVLDGYHIEAGRLFRWFTTSSLQQRLGPSQLS
jgi:uncharacterized protein (TIGR04255 family)